MVGRPSNRDERYAQVMHAFVRCIARYGLEGASLSQIANEAGLTRQLIRHHLGNREDMVAALTDYVMESFEDQNRAMIAALPPNSRARALLDILFSDAGASDPDMVLAFAALTARASDDPGLRDKCRASLLSFEAAIVETLLADNPSADEARVAETAHAIAALYLNMTSLAPLDMPGAWKARASSVAFKLLEELDDPS